MSARWSRIAIFALLSALAASTPCWAQRSPQHSQLKRLAGVTMPGQPAPMAQPPTPATATTPAATPATPPPTLTPEQMPAQPPQVTYRNGQLSIVAHNSRLSDILTAVRSRTGASLDMPPETANERVAVQLGPGPAPQVLADLLDGSHFDYVILGSPQDPNGVVTLILTRNTGPATSSPPPNRPPQSPQDEEPEMLPEEPPATTPAPPPLSQNPGQPQPQVFPPPAPQQPQTMEQPMPPDQTQPPDQTGQPGQAPTGQQQIKTPEQLLQELRQMQQRQQKPDAQPQN